MPEVGTTDGVKDDVHALVREAVNFFHEVLMLVINRDAAEIGNGRRPPRGTGTIHLKPREAPKLQERCPNPACRAVYQHALARLDVSRTVIGGWTGSIG